MMLPPTSYAAARIGIQSVPTLAKMVVRTWRDESTGETVLIPEMVGRVAPKQARSVGEAAKTVRPGKRK